MCSKSCIDFKLEAYAILFNVVTSSLEKDSGIAKTGLSVILITSEVTLPIRSCIFFSFVRVHITIRNACCFSAY